MRAARPRGAGGLGRAARLRPRRRAVRRPSWRTRWSSRRASSAPCATGPATGPAGATRTRSGEVYRRYREGLDAAGLVDSDLFAWRALEALRPRAGALGRHAGLLLRLRRLHAARARGAARAGRPGGADVTVSLPYEPGREAFKATSTLREELVAMGAEVIHLEAVSDHYADDSRAALHALERGLFETVAGEAVPGDGGAGARRGRRARRAGAVRRGGAGAAAAGHRAGRHRGGHARARATTARWWSRCSAPTASRTRSTARCPWPTPASAAGCSRCCAAPAPHGTAEDLLAYLRTPGQLREPHLADRLEADVRQAGRGGRGRGARAVGEAPLAAGRARRDRRRRGAPRCSSCCGHACGGCSRARTGAGPTCSRAPSWTTRAPSAPRRRRSPR